VNVAATLAAKTMTAFTSQS